MSKLQTGLPVCVREGGHLAEGPYGSVQDHPAEEFIPLGLCTALVTDLTLVAATAGYNSYGGHRMPTETTPDPIPADWLAEFEAMSRRPLATRMRYAFIHTYKPVLDDADYRAFDTMEEYRKWCQDNLPDWLGYGRV